jgi:DNA-binding Lrp family transcriptional regulator
VENREKPVKSKYPTSVQSIERGLTILEELSYEVAGLGITELSRRTGLPASTVHRLLSVFVRRGYVTQDKGQYPYRLDSKFLGFGFLSVNLFCDIYQVMCDRFMDWMLGGGVDVVFVMIDSRSFSVRADRSQAGNGVLLLPELMVSSTRVCGENYREVNDGKCRSMGQGNKGALYRTDEDRGSWCNCVPVSSREGKNGKIKLGAGGKGNLEWSELEDVLSRLLETRDMIRKEKVRGSRNLGLTL